MSITNTYKQNYVQQVEKNNKTYFNQTMFKTNNDPCKKNAINIQYINIIFNFHWMTFFNQHNYFNENNTYNYFSLT